MRSAIVIVVAALSGWLVRGVNDVESAPAPPPQQSVAIPASAPDVAIPRVAPLQLPVDSRGDRNLFAYREWPRRQQEQAAGGMRQAVTTIATPPPAACCPPPALEPPRPQFTHRYLGVFGSREVRVAAFSRDGEVVTARVGERIGEFVLLSIGIESVEVRGVDGVVQRIGVSSSV